MVFNLTALGIAHLTKTQCDRIFSYTYTTNTVAGINSGYIVKEYDQIGNSDAIQATTTKQPRIVNEGILERAVGIDEMNAKYPTFASMSAVNLVSNGDFSNGTTGWVNQFCNASTTGNTYRITSNGSDATLRTYQLLTFASNPANKKLRIKLKARVLDSGTINMTFAIRYSTIFFYFYTIATPTQDQWYDVDITVPVASTWDGNTMLLFAVTTCSSAGVANGKRMELQEVSMLDVTNEGIVTPRYISANDTVLEAPYNDVFNLSNNASIYAKHNPISTGGGGGARIIVKGDIDYGMILSANGILALGSNTASPVVGYVVGNNNISVGTITTNSVGKFYLNGVYIGEDTTPSVIVTGTNSLCKGNRSGLGRGYDGYLLDTIIFNRVLSDSEIKKLK